MQTAPLLLPPVDVALAVAVFWTVGRSHFVCLVLVNVRSMILYSLVSDVEQNNDRVAFS